MSLKYNLINPEKNDGVLFSLGQEAPYQQLEMKIAKERTKQMTFSGKSGRPSSENYYLAISFEAGFLVSPNQVSITLKGQNEGGSSSWRVTHEVDEKDNSDCFFLLPANSNDLVFNDRNSGIDFTVSGIQMESGMGPVNIRTELKYANFRYGDRPPSIPMTQERLITVINNLSYNLSDLGSLVIGTDGMTLEQRLDLTDRVVTRLRNVLPPLQAKLIDSWDFLEGGLPNASRKQQLIIEVSINPDFDGWHTNPDDPEDFEIGFVFENETISTIALESSNDQVKIDAVSANNWTSGDALLTANANTSVSTGSSHISKDNTLRILVEVLPNNLLSYEYLVLAFNNLRNVETDEIILPFDIHIPLYVGPLSIEADRIKIGHDSFPTNLDINGAVSINAPKLKLKQGESLENPNHSLLDNSKNNRILVFTASDTGLLAEIDLKIYGGPYSGTLKVYEGTNTDRGRLLHQQDYSATGNGWYKFEFNKLIPVAKDQKYIITLPRFYGYIISKTDRAWGNTWCYHFRTYYYELSQNNTFLVKDGKVGIGTATPSKSLTIHKRFSDAVITDPDDSDKGIPKSLLRIEADAVNNAAVKNGFGSAIEFAASRGRNMQTGGFLENKIYAGARTTGDFWAFNFKLRNDNNFKDIMTLRSNGNVGIGTTAPHAPLQFSNTAVNRKIVLYDNQNNDHQYYGFGINGSTLRYQIPSTNTSHSHKFFAGASASTSNELMRIRGDGNVGIGTTSPSAKLEVNGSVKLSSNQKIFFADNGEIESFDNHHRIMFRRSENKMEFREHGELIFSAGATTGAQTTSMIIKSNGNIGIGTGATSPSAKLEVAGTIKSTALEIDAGGGGNIGLSVNGRIHSKGSAGGMYVDDAKTLFVGKTDDKIGLYNNGWGLKLDSSGNAIVSGLVQTAYLNVVGSISQEITPFAYYANDMHSGATKGSKNIGGEPKQTQSVSIKASKRVVATEFNATSDARIKSIIGQSDAQQDLNILKQIEITDYTFKDTLGQGSGLNKKVIGQQIAEVFPQAVYTDGKEVVPDIMQSAMVKENAWIDLKNIALKPTDKIRIFFAESKEPVLVEVLEVKEQSFRIATDYRGKVFVYGREVNDFHVVDYEALSMLHLSATQALIGQMDKQEKRLTKLEKQLMMSNLSANGTNGIDC